MSFVDLLDLATFSPTDPEPAQPRPVLGVDGGEDDDVWDVETVDETPEDLEALILGTRDDLDPVA
jgi:hypothetical protein